MGDLDCRRVVVREVMAMRRGSTAGRGEPLTQKRHWAIASTQLGPSILAGECGVPLRGTRIVQLHSNNLTRQRG